MKTSRLYQPVTVAHTRRLPLISWALTRTARYVIGAHRLRRMVALSLIAALTFCLLPNRMSVMPTAQAQISVRGCSPNSEYIIQNCALGGFHEGTLENEAINDLLTAHQLPQDLSGENRERLLDWQRNEIRAAVFDKLLAYIKKDPAERSASEQALVDALVDRVRQRRVLAATKALEEYNKWANNPCNYVAPAGFRYNIPTTCATPSGGVFGGHRPPSFEEFQNYGVSIAYADFQNKPELQVIAGDTARGLGLLGGFAAAGVAGVVGGAIGASLTAGSAIITAIQPFVAASIGAQTATGVIGAVSIGAAAAIVILAVVLGVFQGINVFEDAQIPGKLQEAKTNAENATLDLAQLIATEAGLREVFAEFLQATMPDFPATTGVPAQQDTDPKFLLTPGDTVDPLLRYKDWTGVNHTARLNGGWFVDQAEDGQERLTLSIDYVDAAGLKWTASRVGGEFLHTRTDAPDASFKSAEITYQDWSGAVLTARINNAAPSIAALTVTRKQGPPAPDSIFSSPNTSQIATVNDAEDAEDSLTVDVVSFNPNNGVTVSDLRVDAGGKVTAKVQPSCGALDTGFLLRVTDSTGQSTYAIFKVTITPNNAPVLSYPSAMQHVTVGGALTVDPTAGPSDEGRGINDLPLVGDPTLGDATVSPAGFTGTVQVIKYPLQNGGFVPLPAGRVTINNAGPAGTYTVTVPLTGDCGVTTNATFTLVVTPTDTDGDGVPDSRDNCPTTPNPERAAFRSDRDGNAEIYVMDADGTNQTRLTNNTTFDAEPAFSPDGSRITFVSDRDGNADIYVMNANGTNPVRLTDNPAFDFFPAFSPDGSRIAFASDRDGNAEIYVMDADGTNQTRLTTNPAGDTQPVFSPDGSRIAFASGRDNIGNPGIISNPEIYVMNADGTNPVRLTDNPAFDFSPAFSPDGSRIAFASIRDGNAEIYVMDADGTNQTRLTNNTTFDAEPAFSPDGSRITFVSDRDGNAEIYVMDADGTNPVRLTDNPALDLEPSFVAQADTDRDGLGNACDVNNAPAAVADSYSTNEDTTLNVAAPGVLSNDTDSEGGTLTATLVSEPTNDASFTFNADGSFSYTPGLNFNGTDTFTYKVSDGSLESTAATARITVTPVNDAPTITGGSVTRRQGLPGTSSIIATVGDDLTPAASLIVVPVSVPAGITVSNVTNTNGTISALVGASCGAAPGTYTVSLGVFEPGASLPTAGSTPAVAGQSTSTLIVTVAPDNTPPTVTAPASITIYSDINCQAVIPDVLPRVTVSDGCSAAVTLSQSIAAGTLVGVGQHTITITATDSAGNSNTAQTTFKVVAVPNITVSVTPSSVKRGSKVNLSLAFNNCANSRQTMTLNVVLSTPRVSNRIISLPVVLQAGRRGSMSIPLTIPKSTPAGLYTLTMEGYVGGAKVGTSTAQLTVLP